MKIKEDEDDRIETMFTLKKGYMDIQEEIDFSCRNHFFEHVMTVHHALNHCDNTLYVALKLIDRCLEKKSIKKSNLQLLGYVCLFIAIKYEENELDEFESDRLYAHLNGKYLKRDILNMEYTVLNELKFFITTRTCFYFMCKIKNQIDWDSLQKDDDKSRECRVENKITYMSQYIMEMSILNENIVTYKDSIIGYGALMISAFVYGLDDLICPLIIKEIKNQQLLLRSCIKDQMKCINKAQRNNDYVNHKYHTLLNKRGAFWLKKKDQVEILKKLDTIA